MTLAETCQRITAPDESVAREAQRLLDDKTKTRRSLGRLMAERLPGESTRGLTMYAVMRALQIRRFRVPTPRVRPGDKI